MKARIPAKREIAFRDGTVAFESLPLSIVHYPGHYGAFFGFKHDHNERLKLCSCSYDAIVNYLEHREKEDTNNAIPERSFILSSCDFPLELVRYLMKTKAPNDKGIINHLDFGDRLCHQCNKATPAYYYCHEMYAGVFKQNYGWYIARMAFELGFHPATGTLITENCSDEIRDLAVPPLSVVFNRREQLADDRVALNSFDKEQAKKKRHLMSIAENEVRAKFNHKKIGDAWTSETILFSIITRLWPHEEIERHARPGILDGLEFDVFFPHRKLAVEYQGIQHFEPIKHWGGIESLKKTQSRDEKKKWICNQSGIRLVYFYHYEDLSEQLVYERMTPFLQ